MTFPVEPAFWIVIPLFVLPDITLPAPAAAPPIVLVAAPFCRMTPPNALARARGPAALGPMELPWGGRRARAPPGVPPIVVPAPPLMATPLQAFPIATVPAALVPM